jgi:hypothetical protein
VGGPRPDLEAAFKAMVGEDAQALVVLEVRATIAERRTQASALSDAESKKPRRDHSAGFFL